MKQTHKTHTHTHTHTHTTHHYFPSSLQSGTIFLLMVTFMWYAYTKPYKQRPVNYLEIFLLSNFSILLLLYQLSSNLSYVMELEEVQILNYVEGCDNPQYTPTYRAIILALLYYLPIYTLPVVLLVYVLYKLK